MQIIKLTKPFQAAIANSNNKDFDFVIKINSTDPKDIQALKDLGCHHVVSNLLTAVALDRMAIDQISELDYVLTLEYIEKTEEDG